MTTSFLLTLTKNSQERVTQVEESYASLAKKPHDVSHLHRIMTIFMNSQQNQDDYTLTSCKDHFIGIRNKAACGMRDTSGELTDRYAQQYIDQFDAWYGAHPAPLSTKSCSIQ